MKQVTILLLNNFGDILYATPISRQIKEVDFPGCHLTWVVSTQCSDILKGNPYIDQIENIYLNDISEIYSGRWAEIKSVYEKKLFSGQIDKLFILQPYEKNFLRYKDSIRNMILNAYPHHLTVSKKPLIYLTDEEKNNVKLFLQQNDILSFKNRILFEFSPGSGQTTMTIDEATEVANKIVSQNTSTCVIMSSKKGLCINNKNIINGNSLTFKQNAELINNCSLLLGCSSGITWLSTSEYCRPIPIIQFLDSQSDWFNSFKADCLMQDIKVNNLIELYAFNIPLIIQTVSSFINDGIVTAKLKFDQKLKKRFQKNISFSISNNFFHNNNRKLLFKFFLLNSMNGYSLIMHNIKLLRKLSLSKASDYFKKENY